VTLKVKFAFVFLGISKNLTNRAFVFLCRLLLHFYSKFSIKTTREEKTEMPTKTGRKALECREIPKFCIVFVVSTSDESKSMAG
jgi:hypothetical protein